MRVAGGSGSVGVSPQRHWAVLGLLFNAFVFGVSWWPLRHLQGLGLHPVWATVAIYAIGVGGVLLWRPQALLEWFKHPWLWVLTFSSGLNNLGFNWAMVTGDVVRVVLLFYLMPAWSVLLAWWLLKEDPTRAAALRLLLALCGLFVMLKAPEQAWPLPSGLADWLALMGGFMFALSNVLLRKVGHVPPPARLFSMFSGGLFTGLLVGLMGGAFGLVAPPPALAWGWVLIVVGVTVFFVLANMTLQYSAPRMSAGASSVILLSEVVFAGVSSVALGSAELLPRTVLGGSLILLAAIFAALEKRRP